MNLLESAGFSRSNPYYVVQQGKVGSLFECCSHAFGFFVGAHERMDADCFLDVDERR